MYDLVLRNTRIIDGTGRSAFSADVGIVDTHIVAINSTLPSDEAQQVINAQGMTVAPGFIDAHTHDDLMVLRKSTVLPKVQQGITTLVIGNCGFGLAPMASAHAEAMQSYAAAVLGEDEQHWDWPTLGAFLQTLRTVPLGQLVCALLGHTVLRVAVMGFEPRAASEQEIVQQEALLAEAMQSGAAGLSLGLMYAPGI